MIDITISILTEVVDAIKRRDADFAQVHYIFYLERARDRAIEIIERSSSS